VREVDDFEDGPGLETITEGTISIDETVVNGMEPRDRDIAMVFQNYALYPHMTVRQNMGFGLKYSSDYSAEEIDQRVTEVAQMMGIEELLEDTPEQLSGGQQQRVALGRAIVREPAVFLFDEPLSNLDAKLRTRMRTEISRLQSDLDVTSIYVTHDQAEAMTMADRVAVMNNGVLQQIAPPNEIYDHPTNQFVAGFIGSPSMNFADVTSKQVNDGVKLTLGNGFGSYLVDDSVAETAGVESGQNLRLGVRPEDVHVVRNSSDTPASRLIDVTVDVVEPMGSDNFLTLQCGDDVEWVARVDSSFNPEEGTNLAITFDQSSLHLFDESGDSLKTKGLSDQSYQPEPVTQ
jgi:multiple sugar transport system ATP-binding protein